MAVEQTSRYQLQNQTATILDEGTESSVIANLGAGALGFVIPAIVGSSISFKVAPTKDGTYTALYDRANALVSVPVADDRNYAAPIELLAWPWFKIVSNSTESAGDVVITVVGKA